MEKYKDSFYLWGSFAGTIDFDLGSSVHNLTSINGGFYIAKYDSLGSFIWAKKIEGTPYNNQFYRWARTIKIGADGDIYVTAQFEGSFDLDPDTNNTAILSSSLFSTFVAKYKNNGHFVWAKQIGGSGIITAADTKVDDSGCVYFTGEFNGSIDFDPDTSANIITAVSSFRDHYICKLDTNGRLDFVKTIAAGQGILRSHKLDVDKFGNIYLSGTFQGTIDFDVDTSTFIMTALNSLDAFLLKLGINGTFISANQIQGPKQETIRDILIDDNNNVIICGEFRSDSIDIDFTQNSTYRYSNNSNSYNTFIAKFDPALNLVWANKITEGSSYFTHYSIALAPNKGFLISGNFQDTINFYNQNGSTSNFLISKGLNDALFLSLDSSGIIQWNYHLGDVNRDYGFDVVTFSNNSVMFSGRFQGTIDFNPDTSSINTMSAVNYYAFYLSKFKLSKPTSLDNELKEVKGFSVYPNPTRNFINLKFKNPVKNALVEIRQRVKMELLKRNQDLAINQLH